jgi:hypothetical protein
MLFEGKRQMKTYKLKWDHFGFQISIPDDWYGSKIESIALILDAIRSIQKPSGQISYERTLWGPNGKYLYISITPLLENEPELTINETLEFFDRLAYRQNLNIIATGTIDIANREHFWATYYRTSLLETSQYFFYKEYCLYLNRVEYWLTAALYSGSSAQGLPTDQMIQDNERVYDRIVLSFKLLGGTASVLQRLRQLFEFLQRLRQLFESSRLDSDIVTLEDGRVASIKHRFAARLPDRLILTLPPPDLVLSGYKYIFGAGEEGNGQPLIAIQAYPRIVSIDEVLYTPNRQMLSGPTERRVSGFAAREAICIDHNNQMYVVFLERNRVGYAIELWADDINQFRPMFEHFLASIDWNYRHKSRTLGEFVASNRAERQRMRASQGPIVTIVRLIITAVIVYLLIRMLNG